MNAIRSVLIGFAVAALPSATAVAQKVTYDFDVNRNFALLKTYAFDDSQLRDDPNQGSAMFDSPFIRERTHAAIAAQLDRRGLTRDDAHPDMTITARRSFATEYAISAGSWWGYPAGWGWGYPYVSGFGLGFGYAGPTYAEAITVGTLAIDIKDASTGALIWRGVATKTVHPTTKPEKQAKRVVREVAKMLRSFPPARDEDGDWDDDDDDRS